MGNPYYPYYPYDPLQMQMYGYQPMPMQPMSYPFMYNPIQQPPPPPVALPPEPAPQEDAKTLFVGNLLPGMASELIGIFSAYGEVLNTVQPKGKNYMFIHFKDAECAKEAKDEMNNKNYGNTILKVNFGKQTQPPVQPPVNFAQQQYQQMQQQQHFAMQQTNYEKREENVEYKPKEEERVGIEPTKTLWIGGLNNNEMAVFPQLTAFGEVEKIRIARAKNCGFIEFKNVEDAKRAIDNKIHTLSEECGVRVRYARDVMPQSRLWFPDMPSEFLLPADLPVKPVEEDNIKESTKYIVKVLCEYLTVQGIVFEQVVKNKCDNNNNFEFMKENNEENEYYKWKVFEAVMKKYNMNPLVKDVDGLEDDDIPPWVMEEEKENKVENDGTQEEKKMEMA
ncbi:hypothetical protein EIN_046680 [Entamoeba invadens IP1]|uniref:Uncharacterized protein n=1 Tax=Entamoeba invadens IP1 TaxID=370355 RepID=A0A0A1UH17_ENTIV|nr:hypothetical protein EIN_046680 [Entamoeba invadens IP1]ELP94415.1 hypothetical protein EIN_046680 [Entamoeba invadens IP1]|eukprot:XP_004261186.1 hypothetical protein EIN_046680 [Entamoeba invadens IP1]